MKREIKFRAYNGQTMNYNIMVGKFGAFWVNPGTKNDGLDEKDSASLTPFNTKCSETTIIMQSTGLKDKNGKEIYEGDIVQHEKWDYPFEIIFSIEKSRFVCKMKTGLTQYIHNEGLEVVGNIFETPELLIVREGKK